ncbi:MAG: restriction endonuclease [Okeania sp. SIO3C4]|nr:restriction endonuclease [Okeania sp. SIO3C4]
MNKKSPEFTRFFNPILEVLYELGGSGTSTEVSDLAIEKLNISDEELDKKLKSGASRIKNQIAWARIYLVKSGLLDDSSQRGVWTLRNSSMKKKLDNNEIYELYKEIHTNSIKKNKEKTRNELYQDEESIEPKSSNKKSLLEILQSLSPSGFERICQRLLRESGFSQVIVTGKSGDGGIDGEGILEINPLMSFKVLFQSKRFQGSVGSSVVRDFRGAMQGRADKGIIISTGTFTKDAKKEATRDGVPPIELVDGEKLVKLFQQKKLGVKSKMIYEIDETFFNEYMND